MKADMHEEQVSQRLAAIETLRNAVRAGLRNRGWDDEGIEDVLEDIITSIIGLNHAWVFRVLGNPYGDEANEG